MSCCEILFYIAVFLARQSAQFFLIFLLIVDAKFISTIHAIYDNVNDLDTESYM